MGSKQKILGGIGAFLLTFAAGGTAWAAEYYVATNGSDSNPGTIDKPWKTLQKAADVVAGGDTAYFRAGTYSGGVRFKEKHPPAGQWITFKPYNGEVVVIDSSGSRLDSAIDIAGASYLIIEGFKVTNVNYPSNLVHSCDLNNDPSGSCAAKAASLRGAGGYGISLTGTYYGNASSDNHHIIIRNNEVHHNTAYGIIAGGRKLGTPGQHDIEISNNHLHDNGIPGLKEGYGTYLKGTRLHVYGNVAHHNTGNNFRFATVDHVGTDELIDSVIENNVSYATEGPWLHAGSSGVVDAGAGLVIWGGIGNVVRNSLVYNTRGYGMQIDGVDPAKPDMIYNNTIYGNGYNGIILMKNATAKNNIVFKNAARRSAYEILLLKNSNAENNLVGGSNLMIDTQDSSTESKNIINTDPQFVNPSSGDFGLQAGSPAIDKGFDLKPYVTADFTGKARPEGAAYDIGAFEGAGSKANVLPGVGAGLPAGVGGGAGGIGGGGSSSPFGNCTR